MRRWRRSILCLFGAWLINAPSSPQREASACSAASATETRTAAATTGNWLELDHLMIHVSPGAPERAALEGAGFRIAPELHQHEGQGSASIMVEFADSFLELAWRDEQVRVAPGLEIVATRYQKQADWRESGWSPFGVGMRRRPAAPDSFPVPTKRVRAEWMEPDAFLDILAPGDTLGPRLWVVSASMAANGRAESAGERHRLASPENFQHPNGARRITRVRMFVPSRSRTQAAAMLARHSAVEFRAAKEWRLEVTLDDGVQHVTRDLRPRLPLVFHL